MLKEDTSLDSLKESSSKQFSSSEALEQLLVEHSRSTKKKHIFFYFGILVLILAMGGMFFYFQHEIKSIKYKQHWLRKGMAGLKKEIVGDAQFLIKSHPLIPQILAALPLADSNGIVLNTKTVNIRQVIDPYNASIIEHGSGYLCFFRYDVIRFDEFLEMSPPKQTFSPIYIPSYDHAHLPYRAYIGVVKLDHQFNQTDEECITIDTGTHTSEDARVVKVGDEVYLVYNDLKGSDRARSMHVACLNLEDFSVKFCTDLKLDMNHIEKNWSPFEYIGDDNQPQLMFEYRVSPHKILSLPNPQVGDLHFLLFKDYIPPFTVPWNERQWGEICGGTPPQKIGDQYLGFFHSHFTDFFGHLWYVMGAYTFSASPPFNLTAISQYPIMFKGIYEAIPGNAAHLNKKVIFPCGFVIKEENGKEVIHLSCGENDAAIKILTLDKEQLLKSLKRIKS
jgi:predicted GH43/DUF377 family glycosyl hydrolase